mmetsp:Transcript_21101/g.33080  ORF Transcript_21101/g.33080 Transcript_21101/m.33080 type:complete len:142 (-) Transcript_21101:48-473(-)
MGEPYQVKDMSQDVDSKTLLTVSAHTTPADPPAHTAVVSLGAKRPALGNPVDTGRDEGDRSFEARDRDIEAEEEGGQGEVRVVRGAKERKLTKVAVRRWGRDWGWKMRALGLFKPFETPKPDPGQCVIRGLGVKQGRSNIP